MKHTTHPNHMVESLQVLGGRKQNRTEDSWDSIFSLTSTRQMYHKVLRVGFCFIVLYINLIIIKLLNKKPTNETNEANKGLDSGARVGLSITRNNRRAEHYSASRLQPPSSQQKETIYLQLVGFIREEGGPGMMFLGWKRAESPPSITSLLYQARLGAYQQ